LTNINRVLRSVLRRRAALDYESLYDDLAAWAISDEDIVGPGDSHLVGRIELSVLVGAGLQPAHTLVDFGCGTERLALHAVPLLQGGGYIGIEISDAILQRAKRNRADVHVDASCRVAWLQSTARGFPLRDASADIICGFSVFTHMEHEDSYRYLTDGLRAFAQADGLYCRVYLSSWFARRFFQEEAAVSLAERWGRRVRNVTTSRDYMNEVAKLAGWRVVSWYRGDEASLTVPGLPEPRAFGQSICILERPTSEAV
jgi:SAM-dependent methyltransferase